MSQPIPVHLAGYCDECGREIERHLPKPELGGDHWIRIRCRECGTIVRCSTVIDDGETPHTDQQSIRSWLLSSPDEVACRFPEHNGASRRGEWA